MKIRVGLTGGIASGKSIIARIFESLGIPVYNSDQRAKWLMVHDRQVKNALIKALGNIYLDDGRLDKQLLRKFVFNDPGKREIINSIVHPAVNRDFEYWAQRVDAMYVVKESALLFESGNYKVLDFTIMVYSPEQIRLQRLVERDNIPASQALQKIKSQMDDKQKLKLADFIIINDQFTPILPQVLNLHKFFLIHAI